MMRAKNMKSFVLLLPALLVQSAIGVYPLVYVVWLSCHRFKLTRPGMYPFIGLGNFQVAVNSGVFTKSLIPTIVFTLICVPCIIFLGIFVASLLRRPFRGSSFLRTVTIFPWALPYVTAGLIWSVIFNGQWGFLNKLLNAIGVLNPDNYVSWLVWEKWSAMGAVSVAQIWKELPFAVIFFLAGLQTIPASLMEAAKIDGATGWHIFRHITLPLLRPVILVVGVYELFMTLTTFDIVYIMTGGGPAGATEMLSNLAYRISFSYLDMGRGAAVALMLTLLLFLSIGVFVVLVRAKMEE